jgi:hypothetical protein
MSERMTKERLEEIEARADAATPGPWKHRAVEPLAKWPSIFVNEVEAPQDDGCWIAKVMDHRSCIATPPGDGNASFIAASRTDIPDMAREIRALWEAREKLNQRLQSWTDAYHKGKIDRSGGDF